MADTKQILLQVGTSQAIAIGMMLENLDTNTTGKDDVIGQILVAAGNAASGFQLGNDGKFNAAIRAIVEAGQSYLQSQSPAPASQG